MHGYGGKGWLSMAGWGPVSMPLNSLKQNKIAMRKFTDPEVYINIDLQGCSTEDFDDAEAIRKLGCQQVRTYLQAHRVGR